jgi:uncharacterized protein (DUF58 family)
MWWKFRKSPRSAPQPVSEDEGEIRAAGRAPLSRIARQVKKVELVTRKKSSALLSGEYKSRFKGQGMQFSDSRVYQYGDDIRHIDWRTTARMQDTYVKTFEEERELTLLFAVDASASARFGSTGVTKRETLAIALACLGFSAIDNNDRVGLVFFTDRVERFIPPKKGRKHILRLIDELLTFSPASKRSDMNGVLEFLSRTLKHGAVIVLASDFFSRFDKKKLELLARKHDFISLRASDPRDLELPDVGLLRLEDPESGETVVLPTSSASVRKDYASSQRAFRSAMSQIIRKSGSALVDLPTDAEPARVLHQFFLSRKGVKG